MKLNHFEFALFGFSIFQLSWGDPTDFAKALTEKKDTDKADDFGNFPDLEAPQEGYDEAVATIEEGFAALLAALGLPPEEGDGMDAAPAWIMSEVLKRIAEGLAPLELRREEETHAYLSRVLLRFNAHEVQSGSSRVRHAEGLILQLPTDHDGRNTWLLNYGVGDEARNKRQLRKIVLDPVTQSAELMGIVEKPQP